MRKSPLKRRCKSACIARIFNYLYLMGQICFLTKELIHIPLFFSSILGTFMPLQSPGASEKAPYGIHPLFKKSAVAVQPPRPKIHVTDRVVNAEAMVLGHLAERSLPFTEAPGIIKLTKALARDMEALNELSMDRTSASIKMRLGVAQTVKEELIRAMRSGPFSLNIDEATSNNLHKVLCVLVSRYSAPGKKVVVEHLASVSLIKVDSETVFNAIEKLMEDNEIPWSNLMSVLMDSCNVMRGSKSGVEVRLRAKAPHMLDIDGDTCHHAHNAAKEFCKPYGHIVEGMLNDLHNDFRWSKDLEEFLKELCSLIGVKFHMPDRYVSHRWLSVYDVTVSTNTILDALTVFYYGFLSTEERKVNQPRVVEIYFRNSVSDKARDRIRVIHSVLAKKNMTKDGKERKERIIDRLFRDRKTTTMIMSVYTAVLPILKKYVMLFQMTEPLVHMLNEKQTELLREFLACFIKPEVIVAQKTSKQLSELSTHDGKNRLPSKDMFVGTKASAIVKESSSKNQNVVDSFLKATEAAYINCAKKLQTKMPVNNKLLKSVAAVDPECRGHSVSQKYMLRLPTLISNVLKEEELDNYETQVRLFQTCPERKLPDLYQTSQDGTSTIKRIDTWWSEVKEIGNFQCLSKIVLAILTCFHGPQVESAFSVMGEVIDVKSSRTNIKTYSAIQSIKYKLKAEGKSATEFFRKADYLHDPVNPILVRNMTSANKRNKEEVKQAREAREKRLQELNVKKKVLSTKRRAKELSEQIAKKARIVHFKTQLNKVKKQV